MRRGTEKQPVTTITLSTSEAFHEAHFWCGACGRHVKWPIERFVARFGELDIAHIAPRLVCRCGASKPHITFAVRATRHITSQYPPHHG